MVQLDGKTVDQIIEYFKKDTTGIRGLAFVPVFDDSPEKIKEILLCQTEFLVHILNAYLLI